MQAVLKDCRVIAFDRFELHPDQRRLLRDGVALTIGARAFDVLLALAQRRDRLVTKAELLDLVWPGVVVEENNLQVQISTLRKLLGPQVIATVPGRGYRFTAALAGDQRAASSPTAPAESAVAHPDDLPRTLLRSFDDSVPSIGVLPFVNMTDDAANEYFADGVAEELLNVLSRIRSLRVASRTSAFSFKGIKVDIPTVARRLNVATILEGSVRKIGKRVRIAVQLVEAATDSHLWSQTYDRELDDIFAVQDDIARSVVTELRATFWRDKPDRPARAALNAEVRAATLGRGNNAQAYQLYLQGRALVARRTKDSVAAGIDCCRQAVAVDPNCASAWAELANALGIEASIGWVPYPLGFARAREAAEHALALEPNLAEAHTVLAKISESHDWDFRGADASTRHALELAPGASHVLLGAASVAVTLGRLDESIALCRRAIALDPLNVHSHRYLGLYSLFAGHLEQAEAAVKAALELNPLGGLTYAILGDILLSQRRFAEALAAYEREAHDGFRLLGQAVALHALGRHAASAVALAQLGELPVHAYLSAKANAYIGHVDPAFGCLERAYEQRNAGLVQLMVEPLLVNLHGDPRWPAFAAKVGFAV
jgi:TolB-like protein